MAPKCGPKEVLVLNDFGQPVCYCNTEKGFYPLLPSLRFTKDEKNLGDCFKFDEERDACDANETLSSAGQKGILTCATTPDSVPNSVFGNLEGTICRPNHILRFNKCLPIRGEWIPGLQSKWQDNTFHQLCQTNQHYLKLLKAVSGASTLSSWLLVLQ